MSKSRMMRVHKDFSEVMSMISEEEEKSRIEVSKDLARLFRTGNIRIGRMNKKGNFLDIIAISFFVLILAVIILLGGLIFHNVNDEVQSMDDTVATPEAKAKIGGLEAKFGSIWDGIFIFILFGMIIASLIGAYFVDSHPVFMAITLIVSLFLLIIGVIVNNVYAAVSENAMMYSYAQNFPMMNAVFNNFLVVLIVYMVLLMFAMYSGKRGEAVV